MKIVFLRFWGEFKIIVKRYLKVSFSTHATLDWCMNSSWRAAALRNSSLGSGQVSSDTKSVVIITRRWGVLVRSGRCTWLNSVSRGPRDTRKIVGINEHLLRKLVDDDDDDDADEDEDGDDDV